MDCPWCGHDNIPGTDHCEECRASLMQEALPLSRIRSRVAERLGEDTVERLLPLPVAAFPPEARLDRVVEEMRARGIGAVLVTDRTGRLEGILTERDLLAQVALEAADLETLTAGQVMTRRPETTRAQSPAAYAVHRITVGNIRYLPLVEDDGRPTGIISAGNIIKYLAETVGICD
jgi:CBS domain-containing protein